jgi:hypothetical protein
MSAGGIRPFTIEVPDKELDELRVQVAAYPNLVYCHQVEPGVHFAAREQPELVAREGRDGLRSVRS